MNRAAKPKIAMSSGASIRPSSAIQAPTPSTAVKTICTANPFRMMPSTDRHIIARPTRYCVSSAVASGA